MPRRTLVSDNAGRLLIGTFGKGFSRYEQGRFTLFTEANGFPRDSSEALPAGYHEVYFDASHLASGI